jgi:hypothetical protein
LRKKILSLCVLFISLFGLGCGEDVDIVEPVVESIGFTASVKAGQTKVSIDSSIDVTFNAVINSESVTNSSLFLVKDTSDVIVSTLMSKVIDDQCLLNTPLTGTVTCETDNLTCHLNPDEDLAYDTAYLLCILDRIKLLDPSTGTLESASIAFKTLAPYNIGGTVTGLTGTLVLQNNGGDDLIITKDGNFTFATAVADTEAYKITVKNTSPKEMTCSVAKGSSTINSAHVTDVYIACSHETYQVGGTITGLKETLVIQNNDGDDLTLISTDSTFIFSTEVADGSLYAVTVLTQPTGQNCTITNGSGDLNGSAVSGISIDCIDIFPLAVSVDGLNGTLVLQNKGGDNLTIPSNGNYSFSKLQAEKAPFEITILTQPVGQTCTITYEERPEFITYQGKIILYAAEIECENNALYKRIFFSRNLHNANFATGFANGIAGADAFCNNDEGKPESPGVGTGLYKALMVAGTTRVACTSALCPLGERVDWVLTKNTIYARSDGTIIGTTNSLQLFEFPLNAEVYTPDLGVPLSWTGLNANWTSDPANNCTEWGNSVGGSGAVGKANEVLSQSIRNGQVDCEETQNLYCVEQ